MPRFVDLFCLVDSIPPAAAYQYHIKLPSVGRHCMWSTPVTGHGHCWPWRGPL